MKITEHGRAKVQTDEFKKTIRLIQQQARLEGETHKDVEGTLQVHAAMTLCTAADGTVSMRDDELFPFMVTHAHEIDQAVVGAFK